MIGTSKQNSWLSNQSVARGMKKVEKPTLRLPVSNNAVLFLVLTYYLNWKSTIHSDVFSSVAILVAYALSLSLYLFIWLHYFFGAFQGLSSYLIHQATLQFLFRQVPLSLMRIRPHSKDNAKWHNF